MSTFPDGLYQYGGQPVGSGRYDGMWGTKVYFVDGYNGSDGLSGLSPTSAKATIGAATALATKGDAVYIRPLDYAIGHGTERYAEDVTLTMTNTGYNHAGTTSYPLCTPSNISIIGCVNTFTPQMGVRWKPETAFCLTNTTPCLHVENIGFYAEDLLAVSLLSNGVTDTQRGLDGTTFYNCDIKGGGITAADGFTSLAFRRCRFEPKYNGDVDNALTITCSTNPGSKLTIENCEFLEGSDGTACTDQWITLVGTMKSVLIRDCYFPANTPTGNAFIVAAAGCEGMVANCFFGVADGSTTGIEQGGLITVACYDLTSSDVL